MPHAIAKHVPKAHHIVPEFILEEFTDQDGFLHIIHDHKKQTEFFRQKPGAAFTINDINNIRGRNGERNPKFEELLGKVEGDAAPIAKKIIEEVRRGRIPNLTRDEHEIWCVFVAYQWKRLPDIYETVTPKFELDDMHRNSIAAHEQKFGPLSDAERERLERPEEKSRQLHNLRVGVMAQLPLEALEALLGRGLQIAQIAVPDRSFIIGSNPQLKRSDKKGVTLKDSAMSLWLPIAQDIMVSPGDAGNDILVADFIRGDEITKFNTAVAMRSTTIAGHSSDLVRHSSLLAHAKEHFNAA